MVSSPSQDRSQGARRAALLLAALVCLVHGDVIFFGRSLVNTNYSNPYDWRPLRQNYGPRYVPHETWTSRNLWPYGNVRDPAGVWWVWEPSTQYLKQAIRDREWPLWEPYVASGGAPAMANLAPAFFFPPYLIVVLLGATVALLNAYFLLLIWTPAFFTFLFVRRHDVGFWPSWLAAAAVMLGGAVHQHIGGLLGQTAACLPVVMYVTRLYFDRATGGRAALLAAVYASTALAGFVPVLLAIFGTAAFYGIAVLTTEPIVARWRTAALWFGALASSIGLVAFQYLPALAVREATPQMAALYRDAGLHTMPVRNLYQIVSPTLMGGIHTYLTAPVPPMFEYIPYIGVGAAALALLARTFGSVRRRTLLLATAVPLAVILLKLTGSPLVQWFGRLPRLNEIHIAQYFGVPVGLLIACIAALGLHALVEGGVRVWRAVLVALALVATPASLWFVAKDIDVFASPAADSWIRDWRILAGVSIAFALAIVAAAAATDRPRARVAAAAIVGLLIIGDGVYMGWYPNPRAWSVFDHPVPYIRAMMRESPNDRIFSFGAPDANLGAPYRLFLVDSAMVFNPPRMFRLYTRYSNTPGNVLMRAPEKLFPEPLLDRANVRIVAARRPAAPILAEFERRAYEPVFNDGFTLVFKRPTLPRFLFSSEYQIVSQDAALEAVASVRSSEILLERDPGVPNAPNAPGDPAARVDWYRMNSIGVTIDAPRPGLLYASEAYFDGWSATIDGKPIEILPANYAFRAVPVPAGRSQIVFRYWPRGLTAGIVISAASALSLIGLAIAPAFRRSRETPAVSAQRTTSAAP
jgi:hypothetical protein